MNVASALQQMNSSLAQIAAQMQAGCAANPHHYLYD
jgi:hypothetical protein